MASDFASPEFPPVRDDIPKCDGLSERIAGHAVIEKLLADREGEPSRSLLGRIFGAVPLSPDSYPWYKGALGEIAVGRVLEQLGPEWTVLHAVPVGTGTSDIDHVLIGPAGVFTLNTKNHAGQSVWVAGRTLMVAGKKQRHLYNASYEAVRAAKLLTRGANEVVEVAGVVVVVAPKSMMIREMPSGVAVVTDRQLLRWLNGRPDSLTPRQVAAVAAAAVRPGTWHRHPPVIVNGASLQHEFAALRTLVDRARRRRAGWILALLIGTPLVECVKYFRPRQDGCIWPRLIGFLDADHLAPDRGAQFHGPQDALLLKPVVLGTFLKSLDIQMARSLDSPQSARADFLFLGEIESLCRLRQVQGTTSAASGGG